MKPPVKNRKRAVGISFRDEYNTILILVVLHRCDNSGRFIQMDQTLYHPSIISTLIQ